MQHFGLNILIVILTITLYSCATKHYSDEDMARVSTVVRTCMSIAKGKYYDSDIPEQINEKELIKIIETENSTHFKELDRFDGPLEIKIVTHNKYIAAVVWDSETNQKLLQDLQCTLKLDEKSWKNNVTGSQFTLDWKVCEH